MVPTEKWALFFTYIVAVICCSLMFHHHTRNYNITRPEKPDLSHSITKRAKMVVNWRRSQHDWIVDLFFFPAALDVTRATTMVYLEICSEMAIIRSPSDVAPARSPSLSR